MVVVAHPDDELLGPGATMHRLASEYGTGIHVVILGEGITSRADQRKPGDWEKELQIHRENIEAAKQIIGYGSVAVYQFPDNRFDSVDLLDLIKVVEKEKKSFEPDVIFTHHGGDLNVDHQRTFDAVMTAARPLKGESVRSIVTFETASSTEWQAPTVAKSFLPNLFIEISEQNLQAKIEAMEQYRFEKRAFPHPRSPEALRIRAQQHGVSTGCGLAEAFCLIRCLS